MFTTLAIIVFVVAAIGGLYWYVHEKNPDLAQDVTDTLVDGLKEDAEKVVEDVKEKIDNH
jgi:hypothetical protein